MQSPVRRAPDTQFHRSRNSQRPPPGWHGTLRAQWGPLLSWASLDTSLSAPARGPAHHVGCFSHLLAPCPQPPTSAPGHEVHQPGRSLPPFSAGCFHMVAKGAPATRLLKPGPSAPLLPPLRSRLLNGSRVLTPTFHVQSCRLAGEVFSLSLLICSPASRILPFLFPPLCSRHTSPCQRLQPLHGLSCPLDLSCGSHLLLPLVKLLSIPQSPSRPSPPLAHPPCPTPHRQGVWLAALRSQSPRAELLIDSGLHSSSK